MTQKSGELERSGGASAGSPESRKATATQVPQLSEFSFDALSSLNDWVCNGLRSYNEESLRNMKYSIDANVLFIGQLVKCNTPQSVADTLNNYLREVMQQNRKQTERMIRMHGEMAEELLKQTIDK